MKKKSTSSQVALAFLPGSGGLPGLDESGFARLARETPGVSWLNAAGESEFLALLPKAELALVWRFKREWLDLAPRLRLISTPAAGNEWLEASPGRNLEVWFGSFHGRFMAETVIGMMLALTRGVKDSIDAFAAGELWPRGRIAAGMRPLRGSRAVILGFGSIGKWIGRLLKPFGVAIWGVNRSHLAHPDYFDAADALYPLTDLDSLLPGAEHLIIALPGGSGTERIIDARRLDLLPRGCFVYNVGRGNAIDSRALAERLRSGVLAGAGLDVFPREPLPEGDVLRGCPRLVMLPHVSAFAPGYFDAYLDEFLERLRRRENF